MNVKAIEINDNIILLEQVAAVSKIKPDITEKLFFEVSYLTKKSILFFVKPTPDYGDIFRDCGETIICFQDKSLHILRNEIIKIITEQ